MGPDAMILVFLMLSFKPALSLYSFTITKRPFSSSLLSAIRVVSYAYLRLLITIEWVNANETLARYCVSALFTLTHLIQNRTQ